MPTLKIIARYRDGRLLKGTTNNFSAESPSFHIAPVGSAAGALPTPVSIGELKAIFVVRSFEGNRDYEEKDFFGPADKSYGKRLKVTFRDGEALVGATMNYDRGAMGFFMNPADPASNNLRVFVVNAAVARVEEV